MIIDISAVDLDIRRDRNGSLEPRIVRDGQTRLDGFDDRPGGHTSGPCGNWLSVTMGRARLSRSDDR